MAMKTVGWIASILLFVFLLVILAVVCFYFPTLSSQPRNERIIDCSDLGTEDSYDEYQIERDPKPLLPIKNISEILQTRTSKTSIFTGNLTSVTSSIEKYLNNKNNSNSKLTTTGIEGIIHATFSATPKTNIDINNENREKTENIISKGLLRKKPKILATTSSTVIEHNINNDKFDKNSNSPKLNSSSSSIVEPHHSDENLEDNKNSLLDMFTQKNNKVTPFLISTNTTWLKPQSTLYEMLDEEEEDPYRAKIDFPIEFLVKIISEGSNVFECIRENQKGKNIQPYIIIVTGQSGEKVFIQGDEWLIELHPKRPLITAFDLLYKCYYVLNVEYPQSLQNFYNFIDVFLYKMNVSPKNAATSLHINIVNLNIDESDSESS